MARCGGNFGPCLENAAAITAPSTTVRVAVPAWRTRMPGNDMPGSPRAANTVAFEKYRARR